MTAFEWENIDEVCREIEAEERRRQRKRGFEETVGGSGTVQSGPQSAQLNESDKTAGWVYNTHTYTIHMSTMYLQCRINNLHRIILFSSF